MTCTPKYTTRWSQIMPIMQEDPVAAARLLEERDREIEKAIQDCISGVSTGGPPEFVSFVTAGSQSMNNGSGNADNIGVDGGGITWSMYETSGDYSWWEIATDSWFNRPKINTAGFYIIWAQVGFTYSSASASSASFDVDVNWKGEIRWQAPMWTSGSPKRADYITEPWGQYVGSVMELGIIATNETGGTITISACDISVLKIPYTQPAA